MLQAIFCKPNGTKTVLYNGVEMSPNVAGLTAQEWREVEGAAYVAPVTPVPSVVSRAQFKLALLEIGLLNTVETTIAGSGDAALKINWQDRLEFERSHPLIAQMATMLGKTDAEIDALFILAGSK